MTILLDLGILGGTAILYLFYKFARTMLRLSQEPSLPPLMRDYFMGAFAAYVGMLCASITGGAYTPHPEQTFLWFSLGLSFAYWKLAQDRRVPTARKPYGIGVNWADGLRVGPGDRR